MDYDNGFILQKAVETFESLILYGGTITFQNHRRAY